MITHELDIGETAITPNALDCGTKGSYGIYQLELTFSEEWDGLTKKISFYPPNRAAPVAVTMSSDDEIVPVPQEATANAGICKFIVSGTASGVSLISLEASITVKDTRVPATTPAGSPTPTEIQQIYIAILGSERLPIPDVTGYWKLWNYTTGEYEISEYPCATDAEGGTAGVRGSRISIGTAITGTTATGTVFTGSGITDALANDMYINSTTFNVYNCTLGGAAAVAEWAYIGTIKGASGLTPERGTDYWTAEDIAAMELYIDGYIDTAILGGTS